MNIEHDLNFSSSQGHLLLILQHRFVQRNAVCGYSNTEQTYSCTVCYSKPHLQHGSFWMRPPDLRLSMASHQTEAQHSLQDFWRSVWQHWMCDGMKVIYSSTDQNFRDDNMRQAGAREACGGRVAAESRSSVKYIFTPHLVNWRFITTNLRVDMER